jgi:peptidoglycan/xylan/chitin deacetylase (PgdA/CDA1 family)
MPDARDGRGRGRDVMVLCYHAVSPTWEASLSVTPEHLERQLTSLVIAGWHGVTFRDAVLGRVQGRALVISFDDAFASVYRLAFPILASLGLVGTVFAPSAFMPDGAPLSWPGVDHWLSGPHAPEMAAMTWSQLGELQVAGWEVGSHTATHPHLTTLPDDALEAELNDSRRAIVAALGSCDTIAYPYGDVDARVAAAAQHCGYSAGAALAGALTDRGPYLWPRIGVYHVDSAWRFALKTSPVLRRARATSWWPTEERT